jgi:hypothetical protein
VKNAQTAASSVGNFGSSLFGKMKGLVGSKQEENQGGEM